LFTNFNDVCRKATLDFYRGVFGPKFRPTGVRPLGDLLARKSRDTEGRKSLERFFQGTFTALRMLPLPAWIPRPEEVDAKASAAALREARKIMARDAAAARGAMKSYAAFDSQLLEVEQAQALLDANLRFKPDAFSVSLATRVETGNAAAKARAGSERLDKQLEPFDAAASRRIVAALSLLGVPQVAKRIDQSVPSRAEVQRMLSVLWLLRGLLDELLAVRNANAALALLTRQIAGNQKNVALLRCIGLRMQTQLLQIGKVSEKLAAHRYPLDHAKGDISLAHYALERLPRSEDLGAILNAGRQMLDNLMTLYVRICSRLAATAEAVEKVLGLPES
jgi:hypothetical protein